MKSFNGVLPVSTPRRQAYALLCILLLAGGGLLLLLSLLPYETLKTFADLLSKDGDLESFTPARSAALLPLLRWGGLALAALGGAALPAGSPLRKGFDRGLTAWDSFWPAFWLDGRRLLEEIVQGLGFSPAILLLLGLTSLAALNAGLLLDQPMRYDESYTYVVFASRSLGDAISDYHLPNNHVFHTLLVHLSTQLLGNAPWAVRLPAFLAGVLCIPALYLAAARLYNRRVGLLAAGLFAASGVLADYASNARGYTLVVLCFLVSLGLAARVRAQKNRFAWALLALVSALGFYAIPTYLYPFGVVMAWLFLSGLLGDVDGAYGRWGFLRYWAAAGLLAAGLTLLFYTPVFLTSGVAAVAGNSFVTPEGWDTFSETILLRFRNTWRAWTVYMPEWVLLAASLGALVELVFHRRMAKFRVSLPLAGALWIAAALLAQRVTPWPRVWFFLLPLLLLLGAAGLVFAFEQGLRLVGKGPVSKAAYPAGGVLLLTLAAGLVAGQVQGHAGTLFLRPGAVGEAEDAVLFVKERLQPEDGLISAIPLNYPAKYYLMAYGLGKDRLCSSGNCPKDAPRYFVLVNERDGQTLESVLERTRLDEVLDPARAELVHEYVATRVYLLENAAR